MAVRPDMTNQHDVCHGGLIFTLADTAMAYASNGANDKAFVSKAADRANSPSSARHTTRLLIAANKLSRTVALSGSRRWAMRFAATALAKSCSSSRSTPWL